MGSTEEKYRKTPASRTTGFGRTGRRGRDGGFVPSGIRSSYERGHHPVPDADDEGLLGNEYSRTLNRHDDWKSVKVNSLRPNISDPRQDLGRGVGVRAQVS